MEVPNFIRKHRGHEVKRFPPLLWFWLASLALLLVAARIQGGAWPRFIIRTVQAIPYENSKYRVLLDVGADVTLVPQEVRIFLDNRPLLPSQIETVEVPPQPLAILLLMDTTPTMAQGPGPKDAKVRDSLADFLRSISLRQDLFLLWGFDDTPYPITSDFRPPEEIEPDLVRLRARTESTRACLYDAIVQGLRTLRTTTPPGYRPTLVFLTDGDDNVAVQPQQRCSTHSREDVLRQATQPPSVSVFAVVLPFKADEGFQTFVRTLTRRTYGGAFFLDEVQKLDEAFDRLPDFLHPRWSFVLHVEGVSPGEHRLRLEYGPEAVVFSVAFPRPYTLEVTHEIWADVVRLRVAVQDEMGKKPQVVKQIQIRTPQGDPLYVVPMEDATVLPISIEIPKEDLAGVTALRILALDEENNILVAHLYPLPSLAGEIPGTAGALGAPTPVPRSLLTPVVPAGWPDTENTGGFLRWVGCAGMVFLLLSAAAWWLYRRGSWPGPALPLGRKGTLRSPHPLREASVVEASAPSPSLPRPSSADALSSSKAIQASIPEAYLQILESREPAYIGARILLGRSPVTLGRSVESEVPFPLDDLAPVHVRIQFRDHYFYLESLSEAARVYVNGRPVQASVLRSGDEIRIGEAVRLHFVVPQAAQEDRTLPWIDPMDEAFEEDA